MAEGPTLEKILFELAQIKEIALDLQARQKQMEQRQQSIKADIEAPATGLYQK